MNDKPGRKALFTGPVPTSKTGEGPAVLPEVIEKVLNASIEGDTSARIDPSDVPEDFRSLAESINALIEKNDAEKEDLFSKLDAAEILKQRSEAIIQQNPMPILVADTAFNVTMANAAYAEMSGIPVDQAVRKNLGDFKIYSQEGSGLRQAIQDRRKAYAKVVVELPSGTHTLEQYGIPLFDEMGEIEDILIVYNDITQQVRADEEIQAQMENISELKRQSDTIIQQNPMPILVVDTAFNVVMANAAYAEMSGIPEEQAVRRNLGDFKIYSQEGSGLRQVIQKKAKAYAKVVVELPSGTHTLEQYGIPLFDEMGEIEDILIVYNDITQQAKVDEEIQAQMENISELKRQSDTIIQQNPMPILVVDTAFNVVMANAAYAEMSGIPEEQAVRRNLRNFRVISQEGSGLRRVIREKAKAYAKVVVELPSGTHALEQYGIPLLDEEGEIESILIVYNDITQQVRADEKIRTQMENISGLQHRSDTIIQQNPMPILVVDTTMKITAANEAYVNLTGIDRSRITSMTLRDFEVTGQKGEGIRGLLDGKKRVYGEVTVNFPTGTYILEQYGIPLLDEKDEIESILIVYNDITEMREEEVEILRMQHRIDTMIRQNPLAIATLRPDKSRIDINDEYARMWRGTREETLAKKLYDYDITVISGDHFYACYETRKPARTDVMVQWPDGVKKYLTLNAIPILDADGEIEMAFYVWNDWTDLQEEREEVERTEHRVDAMIKQNPLAIATLRPDKSRIDINDEYARMWRGTREETLAKKLYDYDITILDGDHFYACYETRKLARTDVMVQWPDGVKKYLTLNAIPILDADGEIEMAFYVWNDWTEQQEKEDQIRDLMETARQESERLAESAKELGEALASMSSGDLTAFVEVGNNDPLEIVKNDYNASLTAMRAFLGEVAKAVNQVEETAREVSKSSDEIIRATEQVAVSTQQSSEDARRQLAGIEDVGKDINDLSASVEEIASTSQEVMEHASRAAKEGNEAATLGDVVTKKMLLVEEISKQTVDEIGLLNNQMREINNIVKLITDIANQTNLLALNAAIEAARAGEHGRGFAVVAGEIRNLAGESKQASQDIEDLIRMIQTNTEKTADSMQSSHHEIQEGIDSVNGVIKALNQIVSGVEVVAHGIAEITKATEDQAGSTNNVMQKMDESTHVTRESLERTEDMAALAEEVSASTQEVGSASHQLADMSERLENLMREFKLN